MRAERVQCVCSSRNVYSFLDFFELFFNFLEFFQNPKNYKNSKKFQKKKTSQKIPTNSNNFQKIQRMGVHAGACDIKQMPDPANPFMVLCRGPRLARCARAVHPLRCASPVLPDRA